MNLVIFNVGWMSWNLFLGLLAIVFGWLAVRTKSKVLKVFYLSLWLLFVPNSLYILTDLKHLPDQLSRTYGWVQLIITGQFFFLIAGGLISYIYSLFFFEKFISGLAKGMRFLVFPMIIVINFVISFGVILGRIMRTNSWYVFTEPNRVFQDVVEIVSSATYMSYVIAFWILANIIYLSVRESLSPRKVLLYVFAKN